MSARRSTRRDLNELARLHGVLRSYEDIRGGRCTASPEALFLTLRALGAELDSPADAADALARKRSDLTAPGTEPVHVAWGGRLSHVHVRVPVSCTRSPAELTLRLESGEVRTWKAPFEATRATDEAAPSFRLRFDRKVPVGYHELDIETQGQTYRTHIIAAPRRAFAPSGARTWGVFAPLYSLHDQQSDGAGDFRQLARLAEWTGELGGQYVGTLPLLAAFLDEPFEPSPYSPVSRLFWNEFYVGQHEPARAAGTLVDYRGIAARRRSQLAAEAAAFFATADAEKREAFELFRSSRPRLPDYARFRAVCDRERRNWHTWSARLRNGEIRPGDFDEQVAQYYEYAQWLADRELGGISERARSGGAALYLDMPLGVNPDGYDAWRFRDIFAEGASAGAPPDMLFTGGQDWGFRPMNPERLRRTGYAYLTESLRHHLRHARMLRLDHVMWLFRLYWIPAGLSAREGVYVQYPADELFAVLLTESARHRSEIVGEDLGTVPRAVRSAMARRHVQRIFVVQYELGGGDAQPLNEVPQNAVASVNTHDMPPFASFLNAGDVADQVDLELVDETEAAESRAQRTNLVARLHAHFGTAGDPRALLERIVAHLAVSDARMVLINLEDLWLEERPQNVPGTSAERPNWRRRFDRGTESFMNDPEVLATLRALHELRSGEAAPVSSIPD